MDLEERINNFGKYSSILRSCSLLVLIEPLINSYYIPLSLNDVFNYSSLAFTLQLGGIIFDSLKEVYQKEKNQEDDFFDKYQK